MGATRMTRDGFILLGTFGAALLSASTAYAVRCEPHDSMIAFTETYGEEIKHSELGYVGDDHFIGLVEWTQNKVTHSWSLLLTEQGISCLMLYGGHDGPQT